MISEERVIEFVRLTINCETRICSGLELAARMLRDGANPETIADFLEQWAKDTRDGLSRMEEYVA
jgi:hypothetical protein